MKGTAYFILIVLACYAAAWVGVANGQQSSLPKDVRYFSDRGNHCYIYERRYDAVAMACTR